MIQRLKTIVTPLLYCLLASTNVRLLTFAGWLAIASLLLLPPYAAHAAPGQFTVANCQADQTNYSVRAFTHFAHRGMKIRYACRPTGPGLRGVVTQNSVRKGRVKRGSIAEVSIAAPPGTQMTNFTWAGAMRRRDCRYALQMWADGPGGTRIPLKNVKANRKCPRPRRAQAAQFRETTYSIAGATKVTQRVACIGTKKHKWCSAREPNYIRTERASVVFADAQPPTVAIQHDTPLTQGVWVNGLQHVNYTASDNVGVQYARVYLNGREFASHDRPCVLASPKGPFADLLPCPNGPGQVVINAGEVPEGTQQLVVEAQDAALNRAMSAPAIARIDTTAPPPVDVTVEGGSDWRAENSWAITWINPDEGDRAPIAAVTYELCAAHGTRCTRATQAAPAIARLPITAPGAGEWTLTLWRRDAAGNEARDHGSTPVTLRYDPDPPDVTFAPPDPADPTLVTVHAADALSGLAAGIVEIAPAGSGLWQALPTHKDGSRLSARIDDGALAAGTYLLRAHVRDRAGNSRTADRRGDGQPIAITLPLRSAPRLRAGFERVVRRSSKRRGHVVVLRPTARVGFGERVGIAGRLVASNGRPIAGGSIQLLASVGAGSEQLLETITTDADGRFRTFASGVHTRTLRLVYAGSLQVLPSHRTLQMLVPASTFVRTSRRRLRNGQMVRFSGRVRGLPVPAGGKLVEIQVRFTDRWQTFRTTRSDSLGRWSSRYRFQRTRGVQKYRFRIRLPREAGYPFETSVSRTLVLQVSGT